MKRYPARQKYSDKKLGLKGETIAYFYGMTEKEAIKAFVAVGHAVARKHLVPIMVIDIQNKKQQVYEVVGWNK